LNCHAGEDDDVSVLAHPQPGPSRGIVLFESREAPGAEAFGGLRDRGVTVAAADSGLTLTHGEWGTALLRTDRSPEILGLVDAMLQPEGFITESERATMARARSSVALDVEAGGESPLVARKRFLRFARAVMGSAGLGTIDLVSRRGWSVAAIDDELAMNVELDVTALFAIHVVHDPGGSPNWLHTHGLGDIGRFDVDVVSPDRALADARMDVLRALALAILEGRAVLGGEIALASPDGDVALVDAEEFMRTAAAEHVALRDRDDDHSRARAVVCEPATNALVRYLGRPMPSLYTTGEEQQSSFLKLSTAASESTARRARASFAHLRLLFEATRRTGASPVVKLGFDDDNGSREHMWFRVNALAADTIDATLLSKPFAIAGMYPGHRAVHSVEQLSDWIAPTSRGAARPWYLAPMRRLRGG
jgi:hypothetical protein